MRKLILFEPNDKLRFGRYRDKDTRYIYTFYPDYLEWAIINVEWFVINFESYSNLHSFDRNDEEFVKEVKVFAKENCIYPGDEKKQDFNLQIELNDSKMESFFSEISPIMLVQYTNPPDVPVPYIFSKAALKAMKEKYEKYLKQEDNSFEEKM